MRAQPINLFKQADGKRDPNMRQRTRDGKSFIKVSSGEPQSLYLRELCAFFDAAMLSALDAIVAEKPETDAGVKAALAARLPGRVPAERASVTERLVLLAVREQLAASALWPRIVARTDLLYLATEDLLAKFEACVPALIQLLGADAGDVEIVLAPGLKDPVRVHEKAIGDYVKDFDDWDDDVVIAEACVLDMLRGRAVCRSGSTMLRLQQLLMEGVMLDIGAEGVMLKSARSKIKFAGADLDPMHFRNILNNLIFRVGERSAFVELQLHHKAIYDFNESSGAHDRFEYFRSALKGQYQSGLDQVAPRSRPSGAALPGLVLSRARAWSRLLVV